MEAYGGRESTASVAPTKKLSLDKLRIKLLDALFVWTEPHSKRLKINVHIEKEVLDEKAAEFKS